MCQISIISKDENITNPICNALREQANCVVSTIISDADLSSTDTTLLQSDILLVDLQSLDQTASALS